MTLDPRLLFPEALGLRWGWTPADCARILGLPPLASGSCGLDLTVEQEGVAFDVALVFWDPDVSGAWSFQSVQLSLPLPAGIDPSAYIQSVLEDEPQEGARHAIYAEFQRQQAGVRDHYRTVQQHYLRLLGETPLRAEEAEIARYSAETKALQAGGSRARTWSCRSKQRTVRAGVSRSCG